MTPDQGPFLERRERLPEAVFVGRGGWLRIVDRSLSAALFVRVADRGESGFDLIEVHVAVSDDQYPDVVLGARLMERISYEGIRRCATFFLADKIRERLHEPADQTGDEHWDACFDFRIHAARVPFEVLIASADFNVSRVEHVSPLLSVPPGKKRSDDFYRSVFDLYDQLRRTEARPAAVIAKANDVPLPTVHGWIKRASWIRARDEIAAKSKALEGGGEN
jgi:hypothetical protein